MMFLSSCQFFMTLHFPWSLLVAGMMLSIGGNIGWAQTNASPAPEDLVLTAQHSGQTVAASVGQRIFINLEGNPSTGFSWSLTSSNGDSVVSTGPYVYTATSPGVTGSGGTFSFPFQAVKLGPTTLGLTYRQPWNPEGEVQTFSVTIQVTGESEGPRLSIELMGPTIEITWPVTTSSEYYLKGTSSLTPPRWAAAYILPLTNGPNYKVTLGTAGQALYFRLRR
jgi:inhibitor of cysteine peptidase